MKKWWLLGCILLLLAGCVKNKEIADNDAIAQSESEAVLKSQPETPQTSVPVADNLDDPFVLREKMFLAQFSDIYMNIDDYLGKAIKYEGMFTYYVWEEMDMAYYMVYRMSPGCCGNDGLAGFEVVWPEGAQPTWPQENDWVEVVGVLEQYEDNGQQYLRLRIVSLTVLDVRGLEFVVQ
ncbi:MAG: hypothetical protein LBR25_08390 [Erysipelotrichaceae bacterium]|jgi:uncharacterized membrane protein YcgQ (UPF0703/DUF1980 family)|nr:hypothetical protein [Erysipelotrichaceae bacterium]